MIRKITILDASGEVIGSVERQKGKFVSQAGDEKLRCASVREARRFLFEHIDDYEVEEIVYSLNKD
jgi:hypothetical protein